MVYFKEVLPNPAGDDAGGEWIKLANVGQEESDLSNWTIKDASGKIYQLAIKVPPNTEVVLGRPVTGITLNNEGDTLDLMNASGEKVDTLSYSQAGDDEIIVSSRFIETPLGETLDVSAQEKTALIENSSIVSGDEFSAVLVAVAIALAASILVGLFFKREEKK